MKILDNLASITANPHTSIAVGLALICEVGKIWMPGHRDQWDATQKVFLGYGIIASANTPAVQPDPPKRPIAALTSEGLEDKTSSKV